MLSRSRVCTGEELHSGGGTGEIMKAIQKHCNKVQCTVGLLKFKTGINSFICYVLPEVQGCLKREALYGGHSGTRLKLGLGA